MSSREKILNAVLENQAEGRDLPEVNFGNLISYDDLVAQFELILTRIGGKVAHFKDELSMLSRIGEQQQTATVISTLDADAGQKEYLRGLKSGQLEQVDTVYIRGSLGVAENGAVWVDEDAMVNRLLPFICQHLVLVLRSDQLVATMHHAYQQLDVAGTGFGSFIAGPSKTADIEQSLVIGAHGPRTLTLFISY